MPDFITRNALEEDLLKYPHFFALAPLFNTMNLPPDPPGVSHLIARVTAKTVDKLIFYRQEPVFYFSFHKGHFTNTIDTIIYDPAIPLDRGALYDVVRSECLDKASLLSNHSKFEYYTTDDRLNHEVLKGLGFTMTKNHRIMSIMLDLREKPVVRSIEGSRVYPVESQADMRDRVRVQNDVFENRNRTPLVFQDIQKEMQNSNYMPKLSLLLKLDGISCGYGQVIHNPSGYYLVNFGVIPEFQGQGLSHILLEELLERAQSLGLSQIMLEVFEDNIRAVRLYEKHGFKRFYNKCLWLYQKNQEWEPVDLEML